MLLNGVVYSVRSRGPTRYPVAVPLKKIDAETVADALVDIYSRLGIPEEVLSDQGT